MIIFTSEIYLEHLEESSFLYEQRLGLFDDPELTWEDIEDFEDRFEPHIDGLVVGGEAALEVCKKQAVEGDFGELHATVRVFCRQDRKDLVLKVLNQLDPEDSEKMTAVGDALKYEMPAAWQSDIIQLLLDSDKKFTSIMSTVIGYRRIPAGRELLQSLQAADSKAVASIIRALGLLREKEAGAVLLRDFLSHEDKSICYSASLALLRMGEQQTVNYCLNSVQSDAWSLIPLGLGGGRAALSALIDRATGDNVNKECIIALGLIGDILSVNLLLSTLTDEKLAEASATALNLITGADIFEEAFIPEEIDEDELFEEELEDFRKGRIPVRPDGEPFGIEITRISQKPEEWNDWWEKNKSRFDPVIRYRNGKPYSPECLLKNLEYKYTPHIFRRLAYEELVIRYGADLHFETDMPVVQQKKALQEIKQWVQSNRNRFREGAWYFAGQLIP